MVERPREIQFAKWMPKRRAFLSLEEDGKIHIIVSIDFVVLRFDGS